MWLTPQEALDRYERGELAMLPPTIFTLRELAEYATTAEVLAAAPSRDIAPVSRVVRHRRRSSWSSCSRTRRATTRDATPDTRRRPACCAA